MGKIQLYRDSDYKAGAVTLTGDIKNLKEVNFNDVTSSVIVESGTFTLYQDADFEGWSVTVSAVGGPADDGKYPSPKFLGDHNDSVSSVRKNSDKP